MATTESLILAIDARGMQAGAAVGVSAAAGLTRAADEAAAATSRTGVALDRTGATARGAAPAIDATAAAFAREKEAATAAEAALVRNTRAIENAAEEARRAQRDAANLGVSWRGMGDSAREARGPINDLQRSSSDLALAQQALGASSLKALAFATQSTGLLEVATRMQQAVAEFKIANTVIDVTTGVTTKSVSSFGALGGVLLSIATNPVTLVIAGITAAAAAIGFLTRETDEAKKAAEDHKKAIEAQGQAAEEAATKLASLRLSDAAIRRAVEVGDRDEQATAMRQRAEALVSESLRLRATTATLSNRELGALIPGLSQLYADIQPTAQSTPLSYPVARSSAIAEIEAEIQRLRSGADGLTPAKSKDGEDETKRAKAVQELVASLRIENEALSQSAEVNELLSNLRRVGLDQYREFTKAEQEQIAAITAETEALQASRREKEAATVAATEHEEAIKTGIAKLVDRILVENKAAQAEADGVKAVRESISAYEAETAAMQLSEAERAVEVETRRIANAEIAKGHKLTVEETAAIRAMVTARIAGTEAQENQTKADREANAAAERLLATQKQQREESDRRISDLRAETEAIGLSNYERERSRSLRDFDRGVGALPGDEQAGRRSEFETALDANNSKAASDHLRVLREENTLVGLTAEERRRIVEQREFEASYGEQALAANRETLTLIQNQRAELERMERIAFSVGDTLTGGIEDAVYESRKLGSVLISLSKIGFQEYFSNPLRDVIGGGLFGFGNSVTASANGNVFGPSGLHYFAQGDVVSSPTFFGFGGGKLGVMGEDGEEAIMPVTRGSNGRMGVDAHGLGGITIHQTVNISGGGDVYGGVHRSTRQAYEAARSAVGSG